MRCAWNELLSILPPWLRVKVDELSKDPVLEVRLRLGQGPELIRWRENVKIDRTVGKDDLDLIINAASRYSPWAASTVASGYITAPGGHRIGLCGQAVMKFGQMEGLRQITSLCIRVARDIPGLAKELEGQTGSTLILGRPGSGKTTLLRDLIRQRAQRGSVAVVDERGELFPIGSGYDLGSRTDILTGCSKAQGIEMLLRAMSPVTIAVDEITSDEDCQAIMKAGWCGVSLLATAHASSKEDLYTRSVYKPLAQSGLFDDLVTLQPDKTWKVERFKA